jgi:pimeloyl-ACP methyl ester carboxylesterase
MDVDGLGIHFIHERGRGPNPTPLILTHGWPSSFFELTKLIPLLTDPGAHGGDPAQSFEVVVPSLPGYGFSEASHATGMLSSRVAELWATLMPRLGYARFAAFGSDIGAGVTSRLGLYHPERLLGIYVLSVVDPYLGPGARPLSAAAQAFKAVGEEWDRDEGAYSHIQATRPQTLAYGLNDSPMGLAAWIVEKWRAWGDTHGDLESRFSKDDLLTTVMIYWITQTINASTRMYYEYCHHPRPLGPADRVRVPAAIGLTTEPVDRAPREWAERSYDIQRWTEFPRGGHFFAFEEPELLAEELRAFFH